MAVVTVNYSLNKTYFIEQKAFENMISKAAKNSKLTKISSYDVELDALKNDFSIKANILIKKDATLNEAIIGLQKDIEYYSQNLMNSKPQNISFIVEGTF